jgi:uncharacterized protein UPF0489
MNVDVIAPLILDVDFDYCVHPTSTRGYADRARVQSSVWLPPAELVDWLGRRGLLRPESFAGTVKSHEQVLPIWVRLVKSQALRVPFTVLHVDAHPDLMDLDPALAASVERATHLTSDMVIRARPGNFLQFVILVGWVARIWFLFPDRERARIASMEKMSVSEIAAIVRKPIESRARAGGGGLELAVRVGRRTLPVELHTRDTLPTLPPPTVTVLAHSPEFIPPRFDGDFLTLAHSLGAMP